MQQQSQKEPTQTSKILIRKSEMGKCSFVDPNILIWIRIQDFGPIWIRIQGYAVNFKEKI